MRLIFATGFAAAGIAALAACSSTTSGAGHAGSPAPTPTDARGLGTLMQQAVGSVNSAHIALNVQLAGNSVTGSGDEKLSNGKLSAMHLAEQLPGGTGSLELIIADGKTYAKLPSSINPTNKPWVLVSQNSSIPGIQQLSSSINTSLSSASVGNVNVFVNSAKSVTVKGHETVNGVGTTHYHVVVDVTKLSSNLPGGDALAASGIKTIPVDLWVDDQGRPVQVTEKIAVAGQEVDVKVGISKYNQPVSISAPPANQVATR